MNSWKKHSNNSNNRQLLKILLNVAVDKKDCVVVLGSACVRAFTVQSDFFLFSFFSFKTKMCAWWTKKDQSIQTKWGKQPDGPSFKRMKERRKNKRDVIKKGNVTKIIIIRTWSESIWRKKQSHFSWNKRQCTHAPQCVKIPHTVIAIKIFLEPYNLNLWVLVFFCSNALSLGPRKCLSRSVTPLYPFIYYFR